MEKTVSECNDSTSSENQSERYLLEIKGLKKHFDISKGWFNRDRTFLKAVDGIDLKVKRGETLGIVGESGCGKSTTGNAIIRLLEVTDGQVIFEGQDLTALSHRELKKYKKDIQMIFQDPFSSLNPRWKVFDIIAEPLRAHKIAKGKKLRDEVYNLMRIVGLHPSFADRYPHEFSGGQRQRIGIARAIALKPKLIICDEPVSALDVSIQAQILNLLAELQESFQLTYLFIAHGLPAVKHVSDRIAVMYLGKIVELADKEELFTDTIHPYTEGLINSIPVPDPKLRRDKKNMLLEGDIPSPVNPPTGCSFHTRCPYAQAICKTEEPPFVEHKRGHFASCHFPLNQNDAE